MLYGVGYYLSQSILRSPVGGNMLTNCMEQVLCGEKDKGNKANDNTTTSTTTTTNCYYNYYLS